MLSLSKLPPGTPALDEASIEWLQMLVGDWNLVSDLLRADLVLWVADREGAYAIAHCRPANGSTVYYEDPVGEAAERSSDVDLFRVLDGGDRTDTGYTVQREGRPARRGVVPVRHEGRTIAALSVEVPMSIAHLTGSEYQQRLLGERLVEMIIEGSFPIEGAPIPPRRGAPRVGDGVIALDAAGIVTWASPNALSAFHRIGVAGEMVGSSLAELSTGLLQSRAPVDESLPLVLTGRAAWRTDMQARGSTLSLRAVPLHRENERDGAVILVRDVTELRRRERELMTKDATIREVHHRVKNNLQTVAALLRMQARRMHSDEARMALEEAMRRVSTIALVHESLLQGAEETVHFDDVIERCLRLAVDAASAAVRSESETGLASSQVVVRTEKIGRAGTVSAEEATPLALVVAELATNAVEHGLSDQGGTLTVRSERVGSQLKIAVEDDGKGLGTNRPTGLGTSIAITLVQSQLGGTLTWEERPGGGTRAVIEVYLDPLPV